MDPKTLHITNGGILTEQLIKFKMVDRKNIFTWEEVLCVGPTVETVMSDEFIDKRKSFFNDFYDIKLNTTEIRKEFNRFNDIKDYTEVILWFEYDLFCHINMLAVLSLLEQKGIFLPKYLVCSGFVEGEEGLKGLSQLSEKQLKSHFEKKIKLKVDDIGLAKRIWTIYCGNDHNQLFPLITKQSSFPYLSNCLKAHIERFPDSRNGLSRLEYNILNLIKKNEVTSRRHLLGYALHYQGYYGYGDLQLERVIDFLDIFYEVENEHLQLNRKGHLALEYQQNFQEELNNKMMFGGAYAYDFNYHASENRLVKSLI